MERKELDFYKFVIEQNLLSIKASIADTKYYRRYISKNREEYCLKGCDNIHAVLEAIYKALPF